MIFLLSRRAPPCQKRHLRDLIRLAQVARFFAKYMSFPFTTLQNIKTGGTRLCNVHTAQEELMTFHAPVRTAEGYHISVETRLFLNMRKKTRCPCRKSFPMSSKSIAIRISSLRCCANPTLAQQCFPPGTSLGYSFVCLLFYS